MSIKLMEELPEEGGIEQYLVSDEMGNTLYAYCTTIYESISEKFLYEDYNIRNVKLLKKGRSREFNINSEYDLKEGQKKRSHGSMCDNTEFKQETNHAGKKEVNSFTSVLNKESKRTINFRAKNTKPKFSFDEMDIETSTYKKPTRRITDIKPNSTNKDNSLIVPIVICIKTANPYINNSQNLLKALISVIFETEGSYVRDIHNTIFSYSDFCSNILLLSSIILPPPFTELIIPIADKKIIYYEGLISNYPCDSDISIAHLFSLVSPENVITLWTGLLMEKNIVIYASDPNCYFYIVKALTTLMFPLSWPYVKGIILNLELLSTPTPYCYGILKSLFHAKASVIQALEEDEVEYLLLNVNNEGLQVVLPGMKNVPVYPHREKMIRELNQCCAKAEISPKKKLPENKTLCEDFAKRVQNMFYKEISNLLNSFDIAIGRRSTIGGMIEKHMIVKLKNTVKNLKKQEINFLKRMVETQSIASFYDEGVQEKQGNFARQRATDAKGPSPPIELLRIKSNSTHSTVLNRLNKLVKISRANDKDTKESIILPDKKFNWVKEINRMKMIKRRPLKTSMTRVQQIVNSSIVNGFPSNIYKGNAYSFPKKGLEELLVNMEESKVYSQSVVNEVDKRDLTSKAQNNKKERKACFYGRKGILAFLDEFMRQEHQKAHRAIIFEEERNTLEYLKQSITKDSSKNNFLEEHIVEIEATRSEGSVKGEHNEPVVSELVSSLIDLNESPRISLIFNQSSLLLHFTSTSCLQFYLFLGFFYYKHTLNTLTAVKMFIEALKYVQDFATYRSYFPLMAFRSLIKKLDLKTHMELLRETGKVKRILESTYNDRLKELGQLEKEETKAHTNVGESLSYLNNYKIPPITSNEDPNVLVANTLNDLISILKDCKGKGLAFFEMGRKSPQFINIEKRAANLKAIDLFRKNEKLPSDPNNSWLKTFEESITFFLNLHNFTILFGLCKQPPKKFPKSTLDWANLSKNMMIKVGCFIFSAFEIQHAILRACMGPPCNFNYDEDYPVYIVNDPKGRLKCTKAEPLIDFGLYFPYKSAPPLSLYTIQWVTHELQQVAWSCIQRTKFEKHKKQLLLPGIIKEYEDDFLSNTDREKFIGFLKSCIPEHLNNKYLSIFDRLYLFV